MERESAKLDNDRAAYPTYRPSSSSLNQTPPALDSSSSSSSVANLAPQEPAQLHRSLVQNVSHPRQDQNVDKTGWQQDRKVWTTHGHHRRESVDEDEPAPLPAYEVTEQEEPTTTSSKGLLVDSKQQQQQQQTTPEHSLSSSRGTTDYPHEPSRATSSSGASSSMTSSSRHELHEQPSLRNLSAVEAAQYHFRLAQRHLEAAQRFAMGTAALDSDSGSPMLDSPANSISRMPFPLDVDSSPSLRAADKQPVSNQSASPKAERVSPDVDGLSLYTPSEIGRRLLGPRPMGSVSRNNSILSTSERNSGSQSLPPWSGSSSLPDQKRQLPTYSPAPPAHRRHSSVSQDERLKASYRPSMPSINSSPARLQPFAPAQAPSTEEKTPVLMLQVEAESDSKKRVQAWQRQTDTKFMVDEPLRAKESASPFSPQLEHSDHSFDPQTSPTSLDVPHEPRVRSLSEHVLEHPSTFQQWSRARAQGLAASPFVDAYASRSPPQPSTYQPLQQSFVPTTTNQPSMYGDPTSYILSSTGQPIPVYAAPPQPAPTFSNRSLPRLSMHTRPPLHFDPRVSPVSPATYSTPVKPILKRPSTTQALSSGGGGGGGVHVQMPFAPSFVVTTPSTTTTTATPSFETETPLSDKPPSPIETRPASVLSVQSSLTTSATPIESSSSSPSTTTTTTTGKPVSTFSKWSSTFKRSKPSFKNNSISTLTPPSVSSLSTTLSQAQQEDDDVDEDPFRPIIQRSNSLSLSSLNSYVETKDDDRASLHVRFKSPTPSNGETSLGENESVKSDTLNGLVQSFDLLL
ncbi:hypothetical protein ACM66B_006831 [Microbotryomycetes sp. NB124-2]